MFYESFAIPFQVDIDYNVYDNDGYIVKNSYKFCFNRGKYDGFDVIGVCG